MHCTPTPCPHSNARSSPLSHPTAAGHLELDIDVNSNSNCTLKNEYLNEAPSLAEMRFSFRTLYSFKKWPKKTSFKGDFQKR